MFSTDNRPPGFKVYEYEKFSVNRSDRSPHIMSSQPAIKSERHIQLTAQISSGTAPCEVNTSERAKEFPMLP